MIPAYSPQARGRMERSSGTWQGRLPQELRLRGIHDLERANEFLRCEYMTEFNRKFAVPAAQKGSAFVRSKRSDLDWIFSVQHERYRSRTECFNSRRHAGATRSPGKRSWFTSTWTGAYRSVTDRMLLRSMRAINCRRKHPNGVARHACRSRGKRHDNKASFCGTHATPAGEPVQAKPCGRALPGLDRTSGFAFRSTYAKRKIYVTCRQRVSPS